MTRDNFVVLNVNKPSAMRFVKNADRPTLEMHSLKTGPWKCDHGKNPMT